jgi:hypothetical protein
VSPALLALSIAPLLDDAGRARVFVAAMAAS